MSKYYELDSKEGIIDFFKDNGLVLIEDQIQMIMMQGGYIGIFILLMLSHRNIPKRVRKIKEQISKISTSYEINIMYRV